MTTFGETTRKIRREVEKLDELFGIRKSYSIIEESDLMEQSELPNHYKVMNKVEHNSRMELLIQKIARDICSDDEMEEYGWRLINQPKI
jgi:hypothetical protein